ncbi:MAG: hypothetical protein P4L67_02075 [Candidatus Pacebacteria bacterium]|nr:hypothetical protein [Candidatus Paceibacterota bacterium]
MYRKLEKRVQETATAQKKEEPGPEAKAADVSKSKDESESKGVGENEETAAGFGLGKAPKEARPKQPVDVGKGKKGEEEEADEEAKEVPLDEGEEKKEGEEEMPGSEIKTKKEKKVEVLDRQTAFIQYKKVDGKATEEGILSNRKDLKEKTTKMKALEHEINNRKKEIDRLKEQLDKKREQQKAENEAASDVIDEEEFALIKELKDHKKVYKQNYDEYHALRSDVLIIKQNIDKLKQQLILSFDDWYDKTYGPYLNSMSSQGTAQQLHLVVLTSMCELGRRASRRNTTRRSRRRRIPRRWPI